MFQWNKVIDQQLLLESIGNDSALLQTVIELCKQQAEDTVRAMVVGINRGDAERCGRAAHDLKNIGRCVSCAKLIEHSQILEKMSEEHRFKELDVSLTETMQLLDKIHRELGAIHKKWVEK